MIGTKISRCVTANDLENRPGIKLTSQSTNLLLTIHRSFRNFLLHVLVCLILSPCINPQQVDIPFETFSVDEGMPTVTNYILQDRTGYLWFATNSGLYKYDGYNFTAYKLDLDDPTSIIDNTLTTLYEDKAGVLWIGSWLGLEKFDRTTGIFTHYTPNPSDTGNNASNNVWVICED